MSESSGNKLECTKFHLIKDTTYNGVYSQFTFQLKEALIQGGLMLLFMHFVEVADTFEVKKITLKRKLWLRFRVIGFTI